MAIKVVIPQLGQSIAEATVLKWLKKAGERVLKGEALVELGTDKINTEIPAPESGVLEKILVAEGKTVPIETEIAVIADETPAAPQVRYSPVVRKLAEEHGIDLSVLTGSGAGGRVTKEDVERAIAERGQKETVTTETAEERVPMSRMRKLIAEHMSLSRRTAADVTTFFEIDMAEVARHREKIKADFESKQIKLTYLSFLARAVVKALQEFPVVNSSLDGDYIVYRKDVNIGVAVALENGLVVPVIKQAQNRNLMGIAAEMQKLSERARQNRLTPDDLTEGTFTITNPGVFGAIMGTPIIHQPQSAILGFGAIVKRAVVINDAIAIRPVSILSLSYDHRVLDGATADQFLARIKQILENECETLIL